MVADEHVKAYRCHYKYSLKFLKTGTTNLVVPTVALLPVTVIVPPVAVVVLRRRGPSPFVNLGSQSEELDQTKAQWYHP